MVQFVFLCAVSALAQRRDRYFYKMIDIVRCLVSLLPLRNSCHLLKVYRFSGPLSVLTAHIVSTEQMGVPRFLLFGGLVRFFRLTHNVGIVPPHVWADPINRPSIIAIVGLLELSRDGLVTVQEWTVLNLFFGQIDGDGLFFFIHGLQRMRGDQDLPVRKLVSCVSDQITNRAVLVIEIEFFDLPYSPVEAVQCVTL